MNVKNETIEIARLVEQIVPYVTATLAPAFERAAGGPWPDGDWGCVHRGRASSSYTQLEHLLERARAITAKEKSDG